MHCAAARQGFAYSNLISVFESSAIPINDLDRQRAPDRGAEEHCRPTPERLRSRAASYRRYHTHIQANSQPRDAGTPRPWRDGSRGSRALRPCQRAHGAVHVRGGCHQEQPRHPELQVSSAAAAAPARPPSSPLRPASPHSHRRPCLLVHLPACSKIFASLLAGCFSGVAGITGYKGFGVYLAAHALVGAALLVKALPRPAAYFGSA